jgi:hypothetical protein
MFPINDPLIQLDMHRQRVAELIREAESERRGRAARVGRHRMWRGARGRRPTSVTATA